MTVNRQSELASELWAKLGYEECSNLREALRYRMAEHRALIAEERRSAGLSRPSSTRKPTTAARSAEVMGSSETSVSRAQAVSLWAPHLVPEIIAGKIKLWAAYKEAVKAKDAASLMALGMTVD